FQNHFHRPAIGSLFQGKRAQHISASSAKRPEITHLNVIQKPNETGSESIAESLVPWQSARIVCADDARAQRNVGLPLDDRSQKKRQLRGTIAVVAVEENDNIGMVRICKPRQTSTAVSSARLRDDFRAHFSGEVRRSV